ncbi:RING/U-box superfamily protein [Raphanus sativus]|uniref:E3 ubiquitin-protein ligase EL5 n=1 Tax=Raphanus sativus TaxID=3726 RepID=A0A6J0JEB2_RAPSA|nr:E3 ubiquitin-protein ligase EL5 [Raphanus sativus]KAJ4892316.1 RING/U-box superfamily protein [Raphanus sativus]
MFLESVIRFSQLIGESVIISTVVVFSLRLFLRLACFLASRPWRRYRTFTIRRRWRWGKRTAEEDDSSSPYCSICLQDTAEGEKMRRLTACSHCFHADCIDPWLEKRSTCPLCRAQVPPVPQGNPLLALIVPPGVIELFTKGAFASDA